MQLPFTTRQFFEVFRQYNLAIGWVPTVAYLLGILAVILALLRQRRSPAIIYTILGLFWVWMGAVYHIGFFSRINDAALVFGVFFLLQGLLFFLVAGTASPVTASFEPRGNAYGVVGAVLILYAMLLYPLLGWLQGHGYPHAPLYGVAPCPTTIFTFGLLLWARRVPVWLITIPFIWSMIGVSAAFYLGVREDFGLGIAGVIGTCMILYRRFYRASPAPVQ